MPVIEVKHLTKDYGHRRGVFDVNFTVEKGEVYGFLGPNGAGKSTTIRHIMGFAKPDTGSITVNNIDSWTGADVIHNDLGYLPGEIALPESLTGTEFIAMMAKLRGISDMSYTNYLIKKFDLEPSGSLKRMSLGMKRKLAIVTAFMHNPAVLVLDEPTSGLDPIMQQVFVNFIQEEKAKGKTILLSSHLFGEIDETCDKISIIKDGKLISTFVADELKANAQKVFKLEFSDIDSRTQFETVVRETGMEVMAVSGSSLSLGLKDSQVNDFIRLISEYELVSFSETPFSLEDYFMSFYDGNNKVVSGS